jgi:5-guanidino-2-oxopentanoate decarboxylase
MKLLSAYEVDTVFGMAGTMTVELYRGIGVAGSAMCSVATSKAPASWPTATRARPAKPGVCTIIAGPGVTNAATGIAQAYCDSQPMLVLSGACATRTQGKGWGADPRTRRPGRGDGRVHRVQRHGPISGRAAGIDCPCLCGVSRQPAASGSSVAAAGHAPGSVTAGLEDPARPVLADARSGVDRRGRGSPRAGKAPADSRRRRRGRHAHGADRDRRADRGSGSFHQCRQGDSSGIPPLSLGCSIVQEGEPAGTGRRGRRAAGWLGSRQATTSCRNSTYPGDIIRIDIDPAELTSIYSAAVPIQADARAAMLALSVRSLQPQAGGAAVARREPGPGCPRAQCRENDRPRKAARARVEDTLRSVLPADAIVMGDASQIVYTGSLLQCRWKWSAAGTIPARIVPWASPCRWPLAPRSARRIGR